MIKKWIVGICVIGMSFSLFTMPVLADEEKEVAQEETVTDESDQVDTSIPDGAHEESTDLNSNMEDGTAENTEENTAGNSEGQVEENAEENTQGNEIAISADQYAGGHWSSAGGNWYYYFADGSLCKDGFAQISGVTYYLDLSSGIMRTSWIKVESDWYYFNPSSGALQTGWMYYENKWYYLLPNENGRMFYGGFCNVDNVLYHFSASGEMQTGWVKDGADWYYFYTSGALRTGWIFYNNTWYYLDPNANGRMFYGGFCNVDNVLYHFSASGEMQTGWVKDGADWYYFYTSGALRTGWIFYNNTWYYLDPNANGKMSTNELLSIDGKNYYFEPNGNMHIGLQEINGAMYGFSTSGAQYFGGGKCGNIIYYFDPQTGILDQTHLAGVFQDQVTGVTYYSNGDGTLKSGWQWLMKDQKWNWYYFNPTSGAMTTGWILVGTQWYYLDQDGRMRDGWIKSDGNWYYLTRGEGTMKTGWLGLTSDYNRYVWYYLNENGAMETGWAMLGGSWYYFGEDGHMYADEIAPNGWWMDTSGTESHIPHGQIDSAAYYQSQVPYVWGGTSTSGWDCSGYTGWVYANIFGHPLSARDSRGQVKLGYDIDPNNPSTWKAGDLLFYSNDGTDPGVYHVELYTGQGTVLSAGNNLQKKNVNFVFNYVEKSGRVYRVKRIL